MKFGSAVRIITDRTWERYGVGKSIEAITQAFCMNTTLIRADTEEALKSHGSCSQPDIELTVLSCHGFPQKNGPVVLNWTVGRPLNHIEWEDVELRISGQDVGKYFTRGSGALLNLACWSGREEFAQAFLNAGYDAYIAPEKTSDCFSAYQFYTAFLGYAVYEQRDEKPQKLSFEECVERARKIDDFWDGANGYRIFKK